MVGKNGSQESLNCDSGAPNLSQRQSWVWRQVEPQKLFIVVFRRWPPFFAGSDSVALSKTNGNGSYYIKYDHIWMQLNALLIWVILPKVLFQPKLPALGTRTLFSGGNYQCNRSTICLPYVLQMAQRRQFQESLGNSTFQEGGNEGNRKESNNQEFKEEKHMVLSI